MTLRTVAEGKWEECDEYWILRLLDYGYIRKNKSGYEPAIIVFDGQSSEDYLRHFTDEERTEIQQTASELRRIMKDAINFAYKVTAEELPAAIAQKENLCSFACRNNTFDKRDILEQALKNGWIRYDDSTSKAIGAYMYI